MSHVAFRTPNWLGDAVLATVVAPALRRAGAERITVLAPAALAALYRSAPSVDAAVELSGRGEVDAYRQGDYDRVLLGPTSFGSAWRARRGGVAAYGFATEGRGWLLAGALPGSEYRRGRHQVENYRALGGLLGTPREDDEPHVVVLEQDRNQVERLWPQGGGPRIALQVGAAFGPAKRWPAERYAELGRRLAARGADVCLLGGEADRPVTEQVRRRCDAVRDLTGRCSVGGLAAVLESTDLLVTNDTGPMHVAAAVGTRCLALFGSTSPRWTAPRGPGHRVLRSSVQCSPCFRRSCPIGTPCLEGIDVERVAGEVERMLEEGA